MAKILVVDDDEGVRDALCLDLQDEGYQTIAAGTVEEAIRMLDESVSLILTDFGFPATGGEKIVAYVRSRYPTTPVIILTGGDTSSVIEAVGSGEAIILRKPPDWGEFYNIMSFLLRFTGRG